MDSNVVRSIQNCNRKLEKNWAERGEKSWQKFGKKCVKSGWDVAKIIPKSEE